MLRGLMLLALTACPTAIHPPKLRRRAMQDLNRLPPALRGGTVQHLPAGTAVGEALPVPQRLAHNSPQRQGPGWLNDLLTPEGRKVMWDGKAHIPSSDPSQTCVWTQYKSPGQHTQEGMQMCLHSTQDLVSGAIQREGYWGDCDSLAQIWNRQQAGDAARSPDWPLAQDGTFYLEVGTNIGACVLTMLSHTNAKIVAFEPAPRNLFCLTQTILKLPPRYRDRVALFPVAAGNADGTSQIFAAERNHGHSVVGQPVSDGGGHEGFVPNTFYPPSEVLVRRIDHLLIPSAVVAVMKLDVEGFECKAIEGLGGLMSTMHAMRTEAASMLLPPQGCSTSGLVEHMQRAFCKECILGADMRRMPPAQLENFKQQHQGFAEVFAVRQTQAQIAG